MLLAIVVGCIPTALIGLAFSKQFERLFASVTSAGIGLLITGLILIATAWRRNGADGGTNSHDRIGFGHALLIGTAQGIAIVPGISRSGTTIAVALLLGIRREMAARFSFLLAIPAILGALAIEFASSLHAPPPVPGGQGAAAIVLGTFTAAITGIVALIFLLGIVRKGKISLFAYYCWALGLTAVIFGIIRN